MTDSLALAYFLYPRIKQTIALKQYIRTVNISYNYGESYGNEYIRFTYSLEVKDQDWKLLSLNDRDTAFKGSPNFIFTIAANTDRGRSVRSKRLLRILQFRDIYESLTAYAILQLEQGLNAGTSIKVQDISKWPEANYAEKYLLTAMESPHKGFRLHDFEADARQWHQLHQLAKATRKIYVAERARYTMTDTQLHYLSGIVVNDIHYFLLRHKVPIQLEGLTTIDLVHIHTAALATALQQELTSTDYGRFDKAVVRGLLSYFYDHFLVAERNEIVQQQQAAFLKTFPVQQGDILELTDRRLVWVNSIYFDERGAMNVVYAILKNNLRPGERTRTIKLERATYALKANAFAAYLAGNHTKRLQLLHRWMKKKKIPIPAPVFEPDLFQSH